MTVTAAIIVRDEERVLARCLESLRPHVDEIVVVDTGSTDGTKEIATRYADRVVDFAWIDDFAAARQFAFDQASGSWVLWADADDVVTGGEHLRALASEASPGVAGFAFRYVRARDQHGDPSLQFWRERMVRNDGSFRWVGRVHEALVAEGPARVEHSDAVVFEHLPETEDEAAKRDRYLRILEREYDETGGNPPPRSLFYLGMEYAGRGNVARALEVLRRYVAASEPTDEQYQAHLQIARILRRLRRYEEAIDADLAAARVAPRWPMAYFGLAQSHYYLNDWKRVVQWTDLARALPLPDTALFAEVRALTFDWIIYYTNALYQTGDRAAALAWTRRALEIDPEDRWHLQNRTTFTLAQFEPPIDLAAAMASEPDLPTFAVIPVRDRHPMTRALLEQLGLPPERVFVIDNASEEPAREALAGLARVIDHPERNISAMWNAGLDAVAVACPGPHNVAVLNNDLEVPPGFLSGLAAGLRSGPGRVIAYPDYQRRLQPGMLDPLGRMSGYAFMLRGEDGLRADPQFLWWYGDTDLERRARLKGKVVCVGGLTLRHLESNAATTANPELQAITAEDQERYSAKWGVSPV